MSGSLHTCHVSEELILIAKECPRSHYGGRGERGFDTLFTLSLRLVELGFGLC